MSLMNFCKQMFVRQMLCWRQRKQMTKSAGSHKHSSRIQYTYLLLTGLVQLCQLLGESTDAAGTLRSLNLYGQHQILRLKPWAVGARLL